jgi:hypothetical protein
MVQAEMSTISKLSSIRVKLLVGQLVQRAINGGIDYSKLQKLATGTIGEGDVQAAVAALHFVLMGAAKHDVEDSVLAKEVEQLGVPKEHSDAVCKPYAKDKEALRAALLHGTLSVDKLKTLGWDVHVVDSGSGGGAAAGAVAGAELLVSLYMETERQGKVAFDCSEEKFRVLLFELKGARDNLHT